MLVNDTNQKYSVRQKLMITQYLNIKTEWKYEEKIINCSFALHYLFLGYILECGIN